MGSDGQLSSLIPMGASPMTLPSMTTFRLYFCTTMHSPSDVGLPFRRMPQMRLLRMMVDRGRSEPALRSMAFSRLVNPAALVRAPEWYRSLPSMITSIVWRGVCFEAVSCTQSPQS